MELAAPESRCEEHENDLSMRHKCLSLKRSNNDAEDSRIQFAAFVPLFFSCLLSTITITTKLIIIKKSTLSSCPLILIFFFKCTQSNVMFHQITIMAKNSGL